MTSLRRPGERRGLAGVSRVLLVVSVLLAPVTLTWGEPGVGVMGRLALPDLFAAAGILAAVASGRLRGNRIFAAYLVFIGGIGLGVLASRAVGQTLLEVGILAFLGVYFAALVSVFDGEGGWTTILVALALSLTWVSALGLADVLVRATGLSFLPTQPGRGVVGIATFRNSGQAGAFCLVALAVVIPARLQGVQRIVRRRSRWLLGVAPVVGLAFLLTTTKMAAIIGLGFALALVALWPTGTIRWRRRFALILVALVGLLAGIQVIRSNERLVDRFAYKVQRSENQFTEKGQFLARNFGLALEQFSGNPLFGSGIGSFAHVVDKFEVHSTYLKMIGEGGLVGVTVYVFFMAVAGREIFARVDRSSLPGRFVHAAIPFALGCLLSWGYTYHLRKREFWIALAVLYLARRASDAMAGAVVPAGPATAFEAVPGPDRGAGGGA